MLGYIKNGYLKNDLSFNLKGKDEKIMIIIMLGAQGTGKGTVAGLISKDTGLVQVSTGDIFRKNVTEQTELGKKANEYMITGALVPDEITVPMVANRLEEKDVENGIILDGFPRTIEQAEKLDELLSKKGKKVDLVINLTTPKEEIIERILNRRVCSNQACKATYNLVLHPTKKEGICDKCGSEVVQREDDKSREAIENRLSIYDTQTKPLVDYYEKQKVLKTEEVSQKIGRMGEEVAKEVVEMIKGQNND